MLIRTIGAKGFSFYRPFLAGGLCKRDSCQVRRNFSICYLISAENTKSELVKISDDKPFRSVAFSFDLKIRISISLNLIDVSLVFPQIQCLLFSIGWGLPLHNQVTSNTMCKHGFRIVLSMMAQGQNKNICFSPTDRLETSI